MRRMLLRRLRVESGPVDDHVAVFADADGVLKTVAEDGTIAAVGNGGSQTLLTATVELTSAQLLELYDTPVELVPAPGAGKAVICVRASLAYKAGTVPYTLPPGLAVTFLVTWPNNQTYATETFLTYITDNPDLVRVNDLGSCFALEDHASIFAPSGDYGGLGGFATALVDDQALTLCVKPVDALADGDGTVTVYVVYQVIDLPT